MLFTISDGRIGTSLHLLPQPRREIVMHDDFKDALLGAAAFFFLLFVLLFSPVILAVVTAWVA